MTSLRRRIKAEGSSHLHCEFEAFVGIHLLLGDGRKDKKREREKNKRKRES